MVLSLTSQARRAYSKAGRVDRTWLAEDLVVYFNTVGTFGFTSAFFRRILGRGKLFFSSGGRRKLEEQFRKGECQGIMFPTSLAVAKQLFPGGRLRIAAQGALQKPDGSYRPLHDATYGVKVNNGIRPRDQLDFPGPADEAAMMESSRLEGPVVFFGLAAGIKQAHRRVRHRKAD
jgi:hypothetical protein